MTREQRRLYAAAWRQANPEKYAEHKRIQNERRRADPAKYRDRYKAKRRGYQLKCKYGITVADYDVMLTQQGGACAGCGIAADDGPPLNVDHNHRTGGVRGLLCFGCNTAIGLTGESPHRLRALAEYIERTEK